MAHAWPPFHRQAPIRQVHCFCCKILQISNMRSLVPAQAGFYQQSISKLQDRLCTATRKLDTVHLLQCEDRRGGTLLRKIKYIGESFFAGCGDHLRYHITHETPRHTPEILTSLGSTLRMVEIP